MNERIYKIRHKPTGLYYCSKKGRWKDDITNLSKKGNFYEVFTRVQDVYNKDTARAAINKAQTEKFSVPLNKEGSRHYYNTCFAEDFEIVEFEVREIQKGVTS